ncbi:MAG: retroviral-like aspartic protease family protein [Polyangiaceae bacterium]
MRAPRGVLAFFACTAPLSGCSSGQDCTALVDRGQGSPGTVCGVTSATLPVEPGYGAPVVDATVNGTPVKLLLDTGSSAPLLSSTQLLGAANHTWVSGVDLCVGALCFAGVQAYVENSPFTDGAPGDTQGVMGAAILSDLTYELDHLKAVTLSLGGPSCSGSSVAFTLNAALQPVVAAQFDGVTPSMPVLLDTGATETVLDTATAALLGAQLTAGQQPASVCTVNGCTADGGFESTLQAVCVGAHCAQNVTVKYPAWDAVGVTYFSAFHVAFDNAKTKLVFCN